MSSTAPMDAGGYAVGFQGSERSDIFMTIYSQGADRPVSFRSPQSSAVYPLDGQTQRDNNPSIVACSVSKALGGAGQFSVQIKVPPGAPPLFANIIDDDWVDIAIARKNNAVHVLRGFVDDVRRSTQVVGAGTEVTTYTITGRDFQKAYEATSLFFDRYNTEMVAGGLAYQYVQLNSAGNVAATVKLFMNFFLSQVAGKGRSLWSAPTSMPNMQVNPKTGQPDFPTSVVTDVSGYSDQPPRKSLDQSLCQPEGMVWQLAQSWSDPAFCELYTELRPPAQSVSTQVNNLPNTASQCFGQSQMAWVLRDRPFILMDPALSSLGLATGMASSWFKLPTVTVPRQHVTTTDIGRSGAERFNLYTVSPMIGMDDHNTAWTEINKPLWNTADMKAHGVRQYDVVSRYTAGFAPTPNPIEVGRQMRLIQRDYHCMDAYWFNGTIGFGRGVPELRVGQRLKIDNGDPSRNETYYVESISHNFSVNAGLRTQVGVTRGYVGTDANLLSTMSRVIGDYALASKPLGGT